MAKPVVGYLGYDSADDRATVKLAAGLKKLLTEDDPGAAHAPRHENGGSDEIDVTDLSGVLADAQRTDTIVTTTGPTDLTVGAIADGQYLRRSGSTIVGSSVRPASEYWCPPETAHATSDEFDGASFDTGKWTVSDVLVGPWNALSSAGAVDSTTSPAAGTVRITQQNSRLYVQPALGTEVAIRQAVTFASISDAAQFSARCRMPVPLALANNAQIFIGLNLAGPGATPDMTNRAEMDWISLGANNWSWFAQVISGGVQFGAIAGSNFDLMPVEAEFRFLITNQNVKMFLFANGSKHYVLDQNIPNFTMPFTGHLMLRCYAQNVASSNMPFAPIFDCDYVRQLDSANVL